MKLFAAAVLGAASLWGQQPQVENAKVETVALSGTLQAELARHGSGPFWAAWSEPIIHGHRFDGCWSSYSDGNYQDGHVAGAPVRLEGQTTLLIMVRIDNSQVDQVRLSSLDCRFDGGGVPFYSITGVSPEQSIAWLKTQVNERNPERMISAIALHSDPASDKALDELIATTQPARIRERAAFWLGTTRGARGLDILKRMIAADPDMRVREQAVSALAQSKDPNALTLLISEAREDKTPQIRGKALFWLAQKAQKQAVDTIANAVANDPDREVKKQAVQALKQLPESEGVPLLIQVARTNADPEVRKRAMQLLGQSKDPRAIDYFAQVLK